MVENVCSSEGARYFYSILRQRPSAVADVRGSKEFSEVNGKVCFYQTPFGVLVSAQISGLSPANGPCGERVFGFHIHSGDSCTGNQEDPFKNTLTHYDPGGCPHPGHAGDLPPLFGNDGFAFSVFLTDRFSVDEIVGRTIVIHQNPDDFTTQPAGNAGRKIACGLIEGNPIDRMM